MSSLKKPQFGALESVTAFFDTSVEHWRIKEVLLYALQGRPELEHEVKRMRSDINQVILSRRLPERNSDGTVNWANRYAVAMELAEPVTREDIFPNGTAGLSEEEILNQAHEYLGRASARWNFSRQTTAIDPYVLPEVIDVDIRKPAMKLNALPFVRTGSSCSGHAKSAGGFAHSEMYLNFDVRHPDTGRFFQKLNDFCLVYSRQKEVDAFFYYEDMSKGFGAGVIRLMISTPEHWKETSLPEETLTPWQNRVLLLPEYCTEDGHVNCDFDHKNSENKRLWAMADEYAVDYYQQKNSFKHSDQCRELRDRFWRRIGLLSKLFQKSRGY